MTAENSYAFTKKELYELQEINRLLQEAEPENYEDPSYQWVYDIKENGRIVKLTDCSIWEVQGGDVTISCIWIPSDEIIIGENILTKVFSGESVQVIRCY